MLLNKRPSYLTSSFNNNMTSNQQHNNNNNNSKPKKTRNKKIIHKQKSKNNQKLKIINMIKSIRKMIQKTLKRKTFIFAAKNANQIFSITTRHVYVLFHEAKEESSLHKLAVEFVGAKGVLKKTRITLQERLKIKREKYLESDQWNQMSRRTLEQNNTMKSQEILITFNTQVPYRKFYNNTRSMLRKLALEYLKEPRAI